MILSHQCLKWSVSDLLLLYVDGLIITGNSARALTDLRAYMRKSSYNIFRIEKIFFGH